MWLWCKIKIMILKFLYIYIYIYIFLFLFYFVTPLHPINYVVNEKHVLLFMVCSDDIFHDSSLKGGRAPSHDIEYKWNYFIFFVHYTFCIKI